MGRRKQFIVKLSEEDRNQLHEMTRKGVISARVMTRARILLLADEQLQDQEVAQRLSIYHLTVANIRKKYVQEGLEAALYEKPRPKPPSKLGTKETALLIAETCSETPDGREKWTMQMLADRLVTLGVVESISDETVRRTLKKTT